MATAAEAGSVLPNAPVTSQQKNLVPFRKATYERSQVIIGDTVTPGATQQIVQHDVVGDGFMYAIVDDVVCTTAGNAAATTFTEDMTPANAAFWQRMQLSDTSGDIINLAGFENYVNNIQNGQFAVFLPDSAAHSALFVQTAGVGAGVGGSFSTLLRYTVSTGHRNVIGAVGNQSRTVKYTITETIAPSASIWGVAPTAIPAIPIARNYVNYAVPNPQSANGAPQETLPSMFNVIHRVTSSQLEVPAAGSVVTHTVRQIGNTIRSIALILRSNALRATAEATPPTQIALKAGSATLFQESWRVRKEKNLRAYGFDMPNGVVIFDWIHDFDAKAGDEIGLDWLHTQQLSDLHFEITYPAGWNNTNTSIVAVTDELLNVA